MVQELWACSQAKFIYTLAKHLPLCHHKAAPYCEVQFSLSGKIRIPLFSPSAGEEQMSLAAERSFLPPHLPSLYFQVMSPKTLQRQSAGVHCFCDTSPFPQPLNAQDNYSTLHLLTGSERFTLGLYPGSPYIQPSYHCGEFLWISSTPYP